jgi:hypothetical protein
MTEKENQRIQSPTVRFGLWGVVLLGERIRQARVTTGDAIPGEMLRGLDRGQIALNSHRLHTVCQAISCFLFTFFDPGAVSCV